VTRAVRFAQALAEYLFYIEQDPRTTLDLCAEATAAAEYKLWYWKTLIGKCYFRLGGPSMHGV
jgi:hypothetical protein